MSICVKNRIHKHQTILVAFRIAILALGVLSLTGCASYRTPGGGASFRSLGITEQDVEEGTDHAIAMRLDRKPLASFPCSIAVVRVQGVGYRSHTAHGYGYGRFTVITNRDVESSDAFDTFRNLPGIRGIAPLNRMVLPEYLNDEADLRAAAAQVQAEMLLVYTVDTVFHVEEKLAPLSLITLGLLPDDEARVSSTVSAALIDTRNGYVYGLAEASSLQTQIANNWTSKAAIDQTRRRTEKEAFDKLVIEVESMWRNVVDEYAPLEALVPKSSATEEG
ncbi:MAG: hypothetical protein O7G85_04050 [Planctomycetota bacterium]|nr:hypothetical protein [Planctomycetota bacterium]